jgi:N-acetylglucosaminyldiphosphoundecaprenol N-acetyl-beta-D-mannosaminyltransferase
MSYEDSWFRSFINQSDIVFCDGMGVKLAAGILGMPKPYRYTPPDWFSLLCDVSSKNGRSIFLLGGKPGVTEIVREKISCTTQVTVAGNFHGYFDREHSSLENQAVLKMINQAGPDILVVGFGMPRQERWISENFDDLPVNVIISVGAMFDYVAGSVARAPRWMTDNGLEWLARLVIEPRRLWKRYLIGNPQFAWRIFKQRFGFLKMDETTSTRQQKK